MKNTTKLKYILQLYTVTIEMDEEELLHFMVIDKRTGERITFIAKSYSVVVGKAYVYMNKRLKNIGRVTI
ncbi:MAG TPA: hypothetical protein VK808_09600 [Bacteroidia bacterium]|nr:hypothetical protein [Bacteroidia bacterium]